MKRRFAGCLLLIFFSFLGVSSWAQNIAGPQFWSLSAQAPQQDLLRIRPKIFTLYQLQYPGLSSALTSAPQEFTQPVPGSRLHIALPTPDGQFEWFNISQTNMMEPGLASRYTSIKTFAGNGLQNAKLTVRIDVGPLGFHAVVDGGIQGLYQIDPAYNANLNEYLVYYKKDMTPRLLEEGGPLTEGGTTGGRLAQVQRPTPAICAGAQLRSYRLAVACTGEYAAAATGIASPTRAQALAAIVTSVNRVNGVFEKEVAVRLTLVANNDSIVYTNASTDPFTGNQNGNVLINESQTVITSRIGSANFDIGHTFSTGGGGLAQLGCVCITNAKGRGVTGSPQPVGDPYNIDFVAHEIGHQFGGEHTFNANTGNCQGNGSANTNAEPGSGTTIMGYAGICSTNDIAANSHANFHAVSYDQIVNFTNSGTGNTCAQIINTGNAPPSVNAGADFFMPTNVPFILTGTATDPNAGQTLSYSWEQVNTGGPFTNANAPSGNAPLFRSFPPMTNGVRYFPQQANVFNNTTTLGEIMPTYARVLNFRLTARDNAAGGGGICYDENQITVVNTGAQFAVSNPNVNTVMWKAGRYELVTWNPAGTDLAPINTTNVIIELSTNGGVDFTPLVVSTPNDGFQSVIVPSTAAGSSCRVRVRALNSVYYDVSNQNFSTSALTSGNSFSHPEIPPFCSGSPSVALVRTGPSGGNTQVYTLGTSGVPAGLTVQFSKPAFSGLDSFNITLNASSSVASGTYSFVITGTSSGETIERIITVSIINPATSTAPAVSPVAGATDISPLPRFVWRSAPFASSYNLRIATDSLFTNVVRTFNGIPDTGYQISQAEVLNTNTIYFWRVVPVSAACGNSVGMPEASRRFSTGNTDCATQVNTTSAVIPTTTGTASTTITIPSFSSGNNISKVSVGPVSITHSYISDVVVRLSGPDGTQAILFNRKCGNNVDLNLSFDDASSIVTTPCPPTNGAIIRPDSALARYNGKNAAGNWTLSVIDNVIDDGGTLNSWGLTICRSLSVTLPVGYFSADVRWTEPQMAQVFFSTANEVNVLLYEIEKSTDGVNYRPLASLKAQGGIGIGADYSFTERNVQTAVVYYRIRRVDADGKNELSRVLTLRQEAGRKLLVYPNPATSIVMVQQNEPILQLDLFDMQGRKVLSTRPLSRLAQLITAQLNAGEYVLRITDASGVISKPLSVTKK